MHVFGRGLGTWFHIGLQTIHKEKSSRRLKLGSWRFFQAAREETSCAGDQLNCHASDLGQLMDVSQWMDLGQWMDVGQVWCITFYFTFQVEIKFKIASFLIDLKMASQNTIAILWFVQFSHFIIIILKIYSRLSTISSSRHFFPQLILGWTAASQQHKIDSLLVTFTMFILIIHLQVVVYPWEYWSSFPSGEETFFGRMPLLTPPICQCMKFNRRYDASWF